MKASQGWKEVPEVAGHLGVSTDVVMHWICDRDLPAARFGDVWKCRLFDVDEWVMKGGAAKPSRRDSSLLNADADLKQLQQVNHLAQIGTMALSVGHEINNPLTYVIGNQEYISSELLPALEEIATDHAGLTELYEELRRSVEDVSLGARHIEEVVKELRTLAHVDIGAEVKDLTSTVMDAIRMARPALSTSVNVETHLHAKQRVKVHAPHLSQVLINLVTNGAHAVQGIMDPTIVIRSEDVGGVVKLSVEDNGSGISKEDMERIYDPFFTTKSVGEGTGLGLTVCRRLVEEMDATMHIDSVLGEGTQIMISVPVGADTEGPLPEPSRGAADFQGVRVLIIDDDASVVRSLTRQLSFVEVDVCLDPLKAQALIEEGDYDVVLCDLIMPRMTGIALYQRILEIEQPQLWSRFVFMTGGAPSEEARAFASAHASRLIYKPIDIAELKRLFHEALQPAADHAAACPNIQRCPMFPVFRSDQMLTLYKRIYCEAGDGTHTNCARFRSITTGTVPAPDLLPNGGRLRR